MVCNNTIATQINMIIDEFPNFSYVIIEREVTIKNTKL
jgi:hypothetical protein